ncbi:MAG: tetratricopeptide (TPR) repeat protein, partial [Flavobacteriaceae bacterium]
NVMIGGNEIKAGTYAIFTKPNAQSWEVYFYSDSSNWGTPEVWDAEKVVATVKAKVVPMAMNVETLTLSFDDVTNDSVNLGLNWDNVYVAVPLSFMTDTQVTKSIESVMSGPSSGDYYTSAVYYLNANKDINKAINWIDKAIEMSDKPAFWYYRQQSLIYAKSGDKKGAIKAAKESLRLAKEAGNNDYVALNTKSLKVWEGRKYEDK